MDMIGINVEDNKSVSSMIFPAGSVIGKNCEFTNSKFKNNCLFTENCKFTKCKFDTNCKFTRSCEFIKCKFVDEYVYIV